MAAIRISRNNKQNKNINTYATHTHTHTHTHTQAKIHANTQTSKQTIHDKKANSLGWILFHLGDLAQLICSISRKQWTQAIFGCNKFLKKSSCANIDLWFNRYEIKIGLTFFNNHGRTSPKNFHENSSDSKFKQLLVARQWACL